MHLITTALLVFAVWTALAIPAAVFVGRFLHAGSVTTNEANGATRRDPRAA